METNTIYRGDCFDILQEYNFKHSVDLIYLDPPFFTSRNYEVIWGDGYERRAFDDRWKGGIKHYLRWMRKRLEQCSFALKSTGSVFLHCDPHASHYLKVVMDEIFGMNNFRNEIIWKRSLPHGNVKNKFGASHDVILFYARSSKSVFNMQYIPYRQEYVDQFYKYKEPDGRVFRLVSCINPNPNRPNLTYEWKGVTKVWKYTRTRMADMDANNLLVYSKRGTPQYKQYMDKMKGSIMQDIWDDISPLMGSSKEKMGFPTQKPITLLERIVNATTNKGDTVLDPFCGCGTALEAAHKFGRKWVGIDVSPSACKLIYRRLRKAGADPILSNMPTTPAELKELPPFEFENWVASVFKGRVTKKTGDMGIDVWAHAGALPIQVKRSEKVGRKVVDEFETAIQRAHRNEGMIVAFSFTKGTYEEAARASDDGIIITLKTVGEILKEEKENSFGTNSLDQWSTR